MHVYVYVYVYMCVCLCITQAMNIDIMKSFLLFSSLLFSFLLFSSFLHCIISLHSSDRPTHQFITVGEVNDKVFFHLEKFVNFLGKFLDLTRNLAPCAFTFH